MTTQDYAHCDILAKTPKALRRALLIAAAADYAIDLAREDLDADDPTRIRHTVRVNGRSVGYEAYRRADGAGFRLTEIGNLQSGWGRWGAMPRRFTKDDVWLLEFPTVIAARQTRLKTRKA